MSTIQAKILTVKDKVFAHNKREENPLFYMDSKYSKDFIYTESNLFQTHNSFELLKKFTHKKNHEFIENNPIGEDGKKRRKLKNNVELLTEVLINYDKDIFESVNNPHELHQEAEKLAIDFFTKELGFQVLSVATHLDEHHREDKEKRNYHSHITLLNYDFNTHKTVKRTLSKKHLIQIQNIIAIQYEKFGFTRNDIVKDESISNNLLQETLSDSTKIKELESQILELKKKNKNLSTLVSLVLEELNLSQDEISNMNFHAIEEMKDIIYKKLDMLKLYEFLNVGFAPTEEEENLNLLEENFKKASVSKETTINIKTDDF